MKAIKSERGAGRKVAMLSSVHQALDNRVFYREARTLVKAGYDVTLFAIHERDEFRDGVHIRGLPRIPRAQRPVLWQKIAKLAIETEANLYHIHDPELLMITPWIRRVTGRPTVYDIHEANADFIAVKDYLPAAVRHPLAVAFRHLEPRLARGERGLIFADDAIAGSFVEFVGPKTTLFNFPGSELIARGAQSPGIPIESDPVILYLGGMERNRGSELMAAAFAEVVAQFPRARLLIVGHFMPASLEDELCRDLERRGVARSVTITGRVPFETIDEYLRQATIGWVTWQPVPKNQKNVPTKLFEYMAYRLPIVTSDLPSTRLFVTHGVNGLLARADDPTDHAMSLLQLLANREEACSMGQNGRRLVESEYNWGKMEPKLLAIYDEILLSYQGFS